MGQGSSREKGKSKKGSAPTNGVKPNITATNTPNTKKGGRNSKKGKKHQPKEVKDVERPDNLELLEKVASEIENSGLETPRFGIFEDVLPTVCVEEDGVSLSSASSEEETHPKTRMASVHRGSSRKLRKTYSSGRKKSRAARLAKKSHKEKPSDKRSNEEPTVKTLHDELSTPEKFEIKQCIVLTTSEGPLLTEDTLAVLSGDDSGCSTLEDNLFPDDSLSEEVLSCLVSRGMEFDSDVSEITNTSNHSLIPPPKPRRDEGYESLQKTSQVVTTPNRQLCSQISNSTSHHIEQADGNGRTLELHFNNTPRKLITPVNEHDGPNVDDDDWPVISTPQSMNSKRFNQFVLSTDDSTRSEKQSAQFEEKVREDSVSLETRWSSETDKALSPLLVGVISNTQLKERDASHLENTQESEALQMGYEVVPMPNSNILHTEQRASVEHPVPTARKHCSSKGVQKRSSKSESRPPVKSERKWFSKSKESKASMGESKAGVKRYSKSEGKRSSKCNDKRSIKSEDIRLSKGEYERFEKVEFEDEVGTVDVNRGQSESSSRAGLLAVDKLIHHKLDGKGGEPGVQEDDSIKSGQVSWDSGCSSVSLNIGQVHTSEVYV